MSDRVDRRRSSNRAARLNGILLLIVLCASPFFAETVSLQDPVTGSTVSIDLAGDKLTHIVFTAAWCPQCRDELDELRAWEDRWDATGYELILVAVQTRHDRDRLKRFASEDLPGRLLFDSDGELQKQLSAGQLPTHLVFDREGKEILRASRIQPDLEEKLQALLSASRKRRPGRE